MSLQVDRRRRRRAQSEIEGVMNVAAIELDPKWCRMAIKERYRHGASAATACRSYRDYDEEDYRPCHDCCRLFIAWPRG